MIKSNGLPASAQLKLPRRSGIRTNLSTVQKWKVPSPVNPVRPAAPKLANIKPGR